MCAFAQCGYWEGKITQCVDNYTNYWIKCPKELPFWRPVQEVLNWTFIDEPKPVPPSAPHVLEPLSESEMQRVDQYYQFINQPLDQFIDRPLVQPPPQQQQQQQPHDYHTRSTPAATAVPPPPPKRRPPPKSPPKTHQPTTYPPPTRRATAHRPTHSK